MANGLAKIVTTDDARAMIVEFSKQVVGFVVDDEQTEHDAQEFSRDLQTASVNFESARKAEKQPHWDAGVAVDADWKPVKDAIGEMKVELDRTIINYKKEQKRKADELARKQELERLEHERKERARLEEEAKKAEKEDDKVGAEQIRDMKHSVTAPTPTPTPLYDMPKTPVKVKGVNVKETWTGEVRPNQVELLAAAIKRHNKKCDEGDELMPAAYWMPNQPAINKIAEKTKGAIDIDGVRWKCDDSLVSQKRK